MRQRWRELAAALILGALILFTLSGAVIAAPPWPDASNEFWKQTYGVTDAQLGTVAGGYADGTFRPYRAVTRAEFAKMAVSGLGIATKNPATPTFMDVLPGSTFYIYVEGAYAVGLVEGLTTPAGRVFAPGADISRQQANSILGRYLSEQELEVTGVIAGWTGGESGGATYPSLEAWYAPMGFDLLTRFTDYEDVLPAHAPGTAYLIFHQVLKGSGGTFDPGAAFPRGEMLHPAANLSRAQGAAMILRVKGVKFTRELPYVFGLEPTSGPATGGTTVVIYGSHFAGATAVMFGDTPASGFTVDSDVQITAVAPAHAEGTVNVHVTTPAGTSVENAYPVYTYTGL